jgi:cob(I)alamin adenosyltransferase
VKIYTRTGDAGDTSLLGGSRVAKDDPRIDAYGTVDELNSHLGLVRAVWQGGPIDEALHEVQRDLFEIGAQLSSTSGKFAGVRPERIAALESAIDEMESELTPLTSFILPGGSAAASHLHVARTVCRRAERLVVALRDESEGSSNTLTYLNRLSDYLFVAARLANARMNVADVPWQR